MTLTLDAPIIEVPEIVDDLTRREFLIGGTAITGLIAAGCGRDDQPADSSSGSATQTVVDDAGRTVQIPADPRRVVILAEEVATHLVTVGYVPYAMAWEFGPDFASWFRGIGGTVGDLSGVVDLGNQGAGNLNIEAIAAAGPDLIIHWSEADDLVRLQEVAPTIGIDPRTNAGGVRYQKQRFLADLVGARPKLEEQVRAYQQSVAAVRARHGDDLSGLQYTFFDTGDGFDPFIYSRANYPYAAVLADLGAAPSKRMTDAAARAGGQTPVSYEVVADYDADVIFVGRADDKPIEPKLANLLGSTFAARADQVIRVDSRRWVFHFAQAELNVLNELDQLLSERELDTSGDFA